MISGGTSWGNKKVIKIEGKMYCTKANGFHTGAEEGKRERFGRRGKRLRAAETNCEKCDERRWF